MIKSYAKSVTALLLFVFSIIAAAAWYFSHQLLYPGIYPCNQEHYVFCDSPSEIGLSYEDVSLETADDIHLKGWFVPGSKADQGVVLVHGRGATRHEGLRDSIALHGQGFNLLLIDLRNSGSSQKSYNSMGFHEVKDVHTGVEYLKDRGISNIGVVGYSMGATTSIMAMSENKQIKAGWFDAGFSDLNTIILEAGERDFNLPKMNWFSGLVRFFYEWRGDLETIQSAPVNVISKISPRPVMIVHGTADRVVDVSHGKRLYEAAQEPKSLWIVPEGRHTRTWQADKEKSSRLISEFFNKGLSEAGV
ncbi:alpha/beta hydrolase [Endozoicomonas arenosclerae]|uniref:alpha/beta hydrolase n=1 Tax=Endozoicomonas arenosclerae TaxID=1633495 RepID=UPI000780AB20|nr:alpha/beta fold hydrolase [Endozoicomonas arenosclerae]